MEAFPPKEIIVVTAGSLYSWTKEEAVPEGRYVVIVNPDKKNSLILVNKDKYAYSHEVSANELQLSLKNKSVIGK